MSDGDNIDCLEAIQMRSSNDIIFATNNFV